MFTLKLYRRNPGADARDINSKIIAVDHVRTMAIGEKHQAIELWAFNEKGDYQAYYIGAPEPGMEAHGKDDLHLNSEPGSWWGWGLLENWEGNTTEHFRPHSFG